MLEKNPGPSVERRARGVWTVVLTLALFGACLSPLMAAEPLSSEPAAGTAQVDGDISEWDLAADYFAEMYRAADPEKDVLARLYLRYDCDTETLYVLVLAVDPQTIDMKNKFDADPQFVKIDDGVSVNETSGDDGAAPDFALYGVAPDGKFALGWEAALKLAPADAPYDLDVHATITDNATAAVVNRGMALTLKCEGPTAVTLNTFAAQPVNLARLLVPVGLLAGILAIAAARIASVGVRLSR